jgi:hypothetical protein
MKRLISFIWKGALCALAFTAGAMVGAPITTALGAVLPLRR